MPPFWVMMTIILIGFPVLALVAEWDNRSRRSDSSKEDK
jgi:hypothetical protein